MLAYIFVYTPSGFMVTGMHPLKKVEPGVRYDSATTAIDGGSHGVVDPGIYAIFSEADDIDPEISPINAAITTDYDLVTIASGKDGWPAIMSGPSTLVDAQQSTRISGAFSHVTDADLQDFAVERGV